MTCSRPVDPTGRVPGGGFLPPVFFVLAAVAVLGFGGSLQYPLAVLRAGGFGAALWFLWRGRKEPLRAGPYPLLVGGFVLLALGHAFSSVYVWVSLQHAVNIALAAILLAWAVLLFRRDVGKAWDATVIAVTALALAEVGIALFQRFHGGDLRPRGTFDNANYLSEFLAAASLLCFARLVWGSDSRRARYAGGAGAVLFLAAAFSLSGSRGVLLASLPAFGVLLVSRFGVRKGGAILAGLGIPALGLLGFRVAGRFFGPDLYNYSRWIIWKSAFRTFLDHPFGVGLGGFKYYWFATQSPVEGAFRRYGKFADTAHNEYLEVLSGLGAAGFLVFLAVLAVPLLLAVRKRREIPEDRRPVAAGAAACLVLSGANALFNSNLHVFGVFFLDAVMLGALMSCLPRGSSSEVTFPSWLRHAGIAACAGLLAATVSAVAGTYSFERGERFLKSGDLARAERAFRLASNVDPFRAAYPDALSAVSFRRFLGERSAGNDVRAIPGTFFETLQWEDKARSLNPREIRYTLRLSWLFLELFRLRGERADTAMALGLADEALRINPYGVDALWRKADILEAMGRRDEAVKVMEAAVSVEPNFCRGYAKLADFARRTDPAEASRWSGKEEECRGKAATLHLEEHEKWLVESPEGR